MPEGVGLRGAGFVVLAFEPFSSLRGSGRDCERKRPVLLAGVSTEVLTAGAFEPPAGRVFITSCLRAQRN